MSFKLQLILKTFEQIRDTSSRLEKDRLLKLVLRSTSATKMLREMLTYTFHPYWNYWVKVKKYNKEKVSRYVSDHLWEEFKNILDELRNRKVTGDKARKLVTTYLDNTESDGFAFWFAQILNRDIKIGMQLKSFEKHLGEFVPKFSPMLAATWDSEEIEDEIAIEPKLDGLRCFAIFPEQGEPTTVSRNGRPIYNTEEILEELSDLKGCIVDGELIGSGKSWGSGISAAHSKNKKVKGLQFVVFDYMPLDSWEKKKNYLTYEERREQIQKDILESEHVKISPILKQGKISAKKIKALGEKCIADGLEGIVIKPLHMRYMFKRCNSWLKYKFKDTIDCRVVGRTKGKVGTRVEKLIGALIVEGKIDGQKFRSEIGQGFKDSDRKYFSELSDSELKRHVVEIEHYGLTGSLRLKHSDKLSAVRNGIFLKIREDKMER